MKQNTRKPIICTWPQLDYTLKALHKNVKADQDRLHDIWKTGAPAPNAIIRNPKDYDERLVQAGNRETRIVFPSMLMKWVREVCEKNSIQASTKEIYFMLDKIQYIYVDQKKASQTSSPVKKLYTSPGRTNGKPQ